MIAHWLAGAQMPSEKTLDNWRQVRNILPGRQGTAKINQRAFPENKEKEGKSEEKGNAYLTQKAFSNMGKGKPCQIEMITAFPGG